MRLVVQVPCLNEEETLPLVLESIPKQIPGIDEIIVLIIDDGSTDRTVEVARELRRRPTSCGTPATAAWAGPSTTACSARWNSAPTSWSTPTATTSTRRSGSPTWCSRSSAGEADIVIADRQVHLVEHFSRCKVALQKFGSKIVNKAAGTDLPDAASGFRAYSRESLMLLNTITRFSYCMETIIQAGNKKLKIVSVPVADQPEDPRVAAVQISMRQHVLKSAGAIIRAYIMYKPYVIFSALAVLFGVLGLIPFVRFAVLQVADSQPGQPPAVAAGRRGAADHVVHVASSSGIISDLIRTNRILIEDTLEHTKKMRFGSGEFLSRPEQLVEYGDVRQPVR